MTDSENKTMDYGAVIADLEAKKRFLDNTIAALKKLANMVGLSADVASDLGGLADGGVSIAMHNGDIPAGAFLGKSIPEAAKLYLSIVKRKQTSKEIGDALLKYGIETTAKNFGVQVHSILDRARKGGSGIVKLERSHWGLAEWYPSGLRSTAAASSPKKGKKGRKTALKERKEIKATASKPKPSSKPTPISDSKPNTSSKQPGAQERVLTFLKSKPGAEVSALEIATALDLKTPIVHMLAGKIVSAKLAEKTMSGKFKAASVKLSASA